MNKHDDRPRKASAVAPLPAAKALDGYYLEARARILDVAAILDRIGRGGGAAVVENDGRVAKIREALRVLLEESGGRAERVQQLFSLDYDPTWQRPTPR
jgi:hypothetical protein